MRVREVAIVIRHWISSNRLNRLKTRSPPSARFMVWLGFALLTYFTAYRPELKKQRFVDPYLSATVRAANLGGYPFSFALSSNSEIQRMNSGYVDPGLPVLVSSVAVAGRSLLGANYRVYQRTIYRVLFALFLLTAVVFILPRVPLPVAASGVAALYLCIVFKLGFFSNTRNWGATFGVLLTAMLVAVATLPAKRAGLPFLVSLGLLVGLTQFIRQESQLVIYGVASVLIGATMLLLLVAYLVLPTRRSWWRGAKPLAGR
jgi:hypothetical protein